jgi:hypothetical protein
VGPICSQFHSRSWVDCNALLVADALILAIMLRCYGEVVRVEVWSLRADWRTMMAMLRPE